MVKIVWERKIKLLDITFLAKFHQLNPEQRTPQTKQIAQGSDGQA